MLTFLFKKKKKNNVNFKQEKRKNKFEFKIWYYQIKYDCCMDDNMFTNYYNM